LNETYRVKFPQNLTEITEQRSVFLLKNVIQSAHSKAQRSSCAAFSYKEKAYEIPNGRREEE
jgi:hypothetical protein